MLLLSECEKWSRAGFFLSRIILGSQQPLPSSPGPAAAGAQRLSVFLARSPEQKTLDERVCAPLDESVNTLDDSQGDQMFSCEKFAHWPQKIAQSVSQPIFSRLKFRPMPKNSPKRRIFT
jgi:hypothetical protein